MITEEYRLPKDIDRNKIYYKITNKKETHKGLQYHDGLIKDIAPFNENPNNSCVRGGIYFTTLEHLPAYFIYGVWIRPLIIPKEARVVLDPEGDKYRVDMVYMLPRMPLENYVTLFNKDTFYWELYTHVLIRYLPQFSNIWVNCEKFDWKHNSGELAKKASEYFDLWWNPDKFDFRYSCLLAKYCHEHFEKWWNPEKFPHEDEDYEFLEVYCHKYKHIWG